MTEQLPVEQFDRFGRTCWRAHCPDCPWTSRNLPFPDPDAALHALSLHKVVCHE